MKGAPIRVLELRGTPEEIGAAHGSAFADEIAVYARGRIELARAGTSLSGGDVLELAARTVPAHQSYSADLYRETAALADAAGIDIATALLVGGYTDMLDTVRAVDAGARVEDNCTAVIVPDEKAGGAGFYAQTWDMNSSATPHVIMLDIEAPGKPRVLVFSTVGCVGQIGMNESGVCVGINNLTAADGRIGVTWPFVVRKALEQSDADSALECVLEAQLAGGHNFHIFDRSGDGYSVEAMPTARRVTRLEGEQIVRTNHCISPECRAVEGARDLALQHSSEIRLSQAIELLDGRAVDVDTLIALTRDERSICRHPEPPFDYETCGAAIMRPKTAEFWACWGVPSENDYERFEISVSV